VATSDRTPHRMRVPVEVAPVMPLAKLFADKSRCPASPLKRLKQQPQTPASRQRALQPSYRKASPAHATSLHRHADTISLTQTCPSRLSPDDLSRAVGGPPGSEGGPQGSLRVVWSAPGSEGEGEIATLHVLLSRARHHHDQPSGRCDQRFTSAACPGHRFLYMHAFSAGQLGTALAPAVACFLNSKMTKYALETSFFSSRKPSLVRLLMKGFRSSLSLSIANRLRTCTTSTSSVAVGRGGVWMHWVQ
jgi:hypothetical protein